VEGGEAGAKWSVSVMEHGSEANPGKARRRASDCGRGKPERPNVTKNSKKQLKVVKIQPKVVEIQLKVSDFITII
jgi:hypothetical protein